MPLAIIIRHIIARPFLKDLIRLKHTRAPIVNYAHVHAVCTRLFFFTSCPRKEPGDKATTEPNQEHRPDGLSVTTNLRHRAAYICQIREWGEDLDVSAYAAITNTEGLFSHVPLELMTI